MGLLHRSALSCPLALAAALVTGGLGAGCFVADAPPETIVACSDVDACPPSHRCELALGRCLPADETVPQAEGIEAATSEDEAVVIVLRGADADGDELVFLVTPPDPAAGSVSDVAGTNVTFTPAPDFSGNATFSYVVKDDAGLLSLPATVTIVVEAVDDPPSFIAPSTLVIDEDQLLQVNIDLFDRPGDGRDAETLQVIDVDSATIERDVGVAEQSLEGESAGTFTRQPDGDFGYLPPADFFGSRFVDVTVRCDGAAATHRLEIVVAPVNDPPFVDVADLSTQEDTPVERRLDLSDVDDPVQDLVVEIDPVDPAVGVVELVELLEPVGPVDPVDPVDPTEPDGASPARALRFSPARGWVGNATVTVRVSDVAGAQVEREIDIRVFPTIAAPGAGSANVLLDEDDFVVVDLAALTIGPAGLAWSIEAATLHGSLDVARLADGQVVYRPADDYFGPDRFVYSVTAPGSSTSVAGTIDLVVAPVPDAPTARDTSLVVPEDGSAAGEIDAFDVDGDALVATVVAQPLHGTVTVDGLSFVYVPFADFAGRDTMDVRVDDGSGGDGAVARVSIDVTPVPDIPAADAIAITVNEDVPTTLTLPGSSVDPGAALEFDIVTGPAHGAVVLLDDRSGRVTYSPAADYAGDDGFDFRVRSAGGTSATARVDVVVLPVNDPPSLQVLSTPTGIEDTEIAVPFIVADVDGDRVEVEVHRRPERGAVTIDLARRVAVYVPRADVHGEDAFELVARDATGATSAVVRALVSILPAPDAPVAVGSAIVVAEDSAVPFVLVGVTRDAVDLDYFVATPPTNGSIEGFDPAVGVGLYRPHADFSGSDSFAFGVRDAAGLTSAAPATIALAVTPVPDAPRLEARGPFLGTEDVALDVSFPVSDPDGDLVEVTVTRPVHARVERLDPTSFRFHPDGDFNGDDQITVTAVDAAGNSAVRAHTLRFAAVPDPPVAIETSVKGDEDQTLTIQLAGASVDGDALRYVLDKAPPDGALTSFNAENGAVVYLPPPDFSGTTTFAFRVINQAGLLSPPATVSVQIAPVNDPPQLEAADLVLAEDTTALLRVVAEDPDADDELTVELVAPPQHGTVLRRPLALRTVLEYLPKANFNGTDLFSLRAIDAAGATSATVVVRVDVLAVPDPPVGIAQTLSVDEDGAVAFVLAGTTVDGGALQFTITAAPSRGVIEGFDGSRGVGTYKPTPDRNGADVFSFVAVDARGVVGPQTTIAVDIAPVRDLPVVTAVPALTVEDVAVEIPVAVVDPDGDATTLEIVTNGNRGEATVLSASRLRYVPRPDENGTDTFSVAARDAVGRGPPTTITVSIAPVPDAPRATAVEAVGAEDAVIVAQLEATSVDREAVSFVLTTAPLNGRIESFNAATGVVLYRGNQNFNGTDTFSFTARTATQTGTTATATVRVLPVNDPPTLTAPTGVVDVPGGGTASIAGLAVVDVDGDSGALAIAQPPDVGAASVAGMAVVFDAPRASERFVGLVTVGVVAVDSAGAQSARADLVFRVVVDDDCATLRNSGVTASGIYRLRGIAARCDMSLDGGGWTMVAKVVGRWSYDDEELWLGDEPHNPEELGSLPLIDAKLEAWGLLPSPEAIRVETFDLSLGDRQRIVVEVGGLRRLGELFKAEEDNAALLTTASLTAWRSAFAPGRVVPLTGTCVREGIALTAAEVDGQTCRLCAVVGSFSPRTSACISPTQSYGLGVAKPLDTNAGAAGEVEDRRRAVIWARSTDFSLTFRDEKACEVHAERGRVVSGLYSVDGSPTFCTF